MPRTLPDRPLPRKAIPPDRRNGRHPVGRVLLTVPVTEPNTDAPTAPPGASSDLPADVSGLTYEQARDELVQVVARLEAGSEPLEASLALWERGEALAARCQQWLDGARQRLAAAQAGATAASDDAETDEDDA